MIELRRIKPRLGIVFCCTQMWLVPYLFQVLQQKQLQGRTCQSGLDVLSYAPTDQLWVAWWNYWCKHLHLPCKCVAKCVHKSSDRQDQAQCNTADKQGETSPDFSDGNTGFSKHDFKELLVPENQNHCMRITGITQDVMNRNVLVDTNPSPTQSRKNVNYFAVVVFLQIGEKFELGL